MNDHDKEKSAHSFLKCVRCDWVDYLDKYRKRCPKCGSRTEDIENLFAGENITVQVTSQALKKRKVKISFEMFSEKFNTIVAEEDMDEIFEDPFDRDRVNFLMRSYLWIMLKKVPQMWLHIDWPARGLKELMTLRMREDIQKEEKIKNKK